MVGRPKSDFLRAHRSSGNSDGRSVASDGTSVNVDGRPGNVAAFALESPRGRDLFTEHRGTATEGRGAPTEDAGTATDDRILGTDGSRTAVAARFRETVGEKAGLSKIREERFWEL